MSERFKYINEGNFVLFREHNDPNSRRPVMKGKIEFDDGRPTLFVSAWAKEKNGKKYLSGTVESLTRERTVRLRPKINKRTLSRSRTTRSRFKEVTR